MNEPIKSDGKPGAKAPEPTKQAEPKIHNLDTTKAGVKIYLEESGKTLKEMPYSASAMRLAVVRFILDTICCEDRQLRAKAYKQFSATPGWFGCNNSAGRQALGYSTPQAEALAEIDDV